MIILTGLNQKKLWLDIKIKFISQSSYPAIGNELT